MSIFSKRKTEPESIDGVFFSSSMKKVSLMIHLFLKLLARQRFFIRHLMVTTRTETAVYSSCRLWTTPDISLFFHRLRE